MRLRRNIREDRKKEYHWLEMEKAGGIFDWKDVSFAIYGFSGKRGGIIREHARRTAGIMKHTI